MAPSLASPAFPYWVYLPACFFTLAMMARCTRSAPPQLASASRRDCFEWGAHAARTRRGEQQHTCHAMPRTFFLGDRPPFWVPSMLNEEADATDELTRDALVDSCAGFLLPACAGRAAMAASEAAHPRQTARRQEPRAPSSGGRKTHMRPVAFE